jgi:hypothetical protein
MTLQNLDTHSDWRMALKFFENWVCTVYVGTEVTVLWRTTWVRNLLLLLYCGLEWWCEAWHTDFSECSNLRNCSPSDQIPEAQRLCHAYKLIHQSPFNFIITSDTVSSCNLKWDTLSENGCLPECSTVESGTYKPTFQMSMSSSPWW